MVMSKLLKINKVILTCISIQVQVAVASLLRYDRLLKLHSNTNLQRNVK